MVGYIRNDIHEQMQRVEMMGKWFAYTTDTLLNNRRKLYIPKSTDENLRACINVYRSAEGQEYNPDILHQEWHKSHRARKEVVIFHHNDLDGEGSAALIRHMMFPVNKKEITFCKYNYSDLNSVKEIVQQMKRKDKQSIRYAIVTDLSFTNSLEGSLFCEIIHNFDFILWIDHHKSSFNNLTYLITALTRERRGAKPFHFIGYLDTRYSATLLAYSILHNTENSIFKDCVQNNPYTFTPAIPILISDYDTANRSSIYYGISKWLNEYYYTMQSMEPDKPIWEYILKYQDNREQLDLSISNILLIGRDLYDLSQKKNKFIYENEALYIMETIISKSDRNNLPIPETKMPIKMIGMVGYGNSDRFASEEDPDHCIFALLRFHDSKMAISFYHNNPESDFATKTKLNLGDILQDKFKGGGHPMAAGLSVEVESFLKAYDDYPITSTLRTTNPLRYSDKVEQIFTKVFNIVLDAIVKKAKMTNLGYWK